MFPVEFVFELPFVDNIWQNVERNFLALES